MTVIKLLRVLILLSLLLILMSNFAIGFRHESHLAIGKGVIVPLEKSPVQINKEILNIHLEEHGFHLKGTIEAKYLLYNPLDNEVNLTVVFPIYYDQNAVVLLDNKELFINHIYPSSLELTLSDFEINQEWIDPLTKETYTPAGGDYEYKTYNPYGLVASFEILLEPHETSNLTVSYTQDPSYENSKYADFIWRYDYLLTPARLWGNYNDLEINIFTPRNMRIASSLSFEKLSETHYQAMYSKLPDENLSFFVTKNRPVRGNYTPSESTLIRSFLPIAFVGVCLYFGFLLISRLKRKD